MTIGSSLSARRPPLARLVSFRSFLVLLGCFCIVKVAILVASFDESELVQPATLSPTPAEDPIQTALDEREFVPWPTVVPEPAAGPEGSDDLVGDEPVVAGVETLTPGQVTALQQLAARRQVLDEREQLLDIRAELNGQAEMRLDKQIERLAALKAEIETLVKTLDDTEESKLARLVKIYETMKPKAAAEIFNRLEMNVLIHVIERMKEAKSAVVLGKMDPTVAKRVTTELARKKERPLLDDNS